MTKPHRMIPQTGDYAQFKEMCNLVSTFNRAVQFNVVPQNRQAIEDAQTVADTATFGDIVETYQTFAHNERHYGAAEAGALASLLNFSLKNHFIDVVRRVVPDEQLAAYVPDALSSKRNVDLLDKYGLHAIAAVVRSSVKLAA